MDDSMCNERWQRVQKHLEDSPIFRDKVTELEMRVKILEQGVMKNAIIGGLIGALIGSGSAPALNGLIKLFFGIV